MLAPTSLSALHAPFERIQNGTECTQGKWQWLTRTRGQRVSPTAARWCYFSFFQGAFNLIMHASYRPKKKRVPSVGWGLERRLRELIQQLRNWYDPHVAAHVQIKGPLSPLAARETCLNSVLA